MGARRRRVARASVGGLAALLAACPGAVADETHGDVNLPALTPEEIAELGLGSAPPSADTVAPGSQDVDADKIPDNQDTGTPDPGEGDPDADADPAPDAAPAPVPDAVPAPVAAPPPPPPSPPPAVPAPAAPAPAPEAVQPPPQAESPPAKARAVEAPDQRRRRPVDPPRIGRQADPPPQPARVQAAPAPRAPVVARERATRPAPAPAPAPVGGGRVVRPGESLWSIAADLLGSAASPARIAAEVERLWQLNRDRIRTGSPDVLPAGFALRT